MAAILHLLSAFRRRLGGALFSPLKSELADRFDSCGDGKMALFDRVFHNQPRRHLTLDLISPAEFERRAGRRVEPAEHCTERSVPPTPHASCLSREKKSGTTSDYLTATVH